MSQKIYLIRHGQTDYNLRGIVQGSGVDAPLNARGQSQAEAFYERYQLVPFQRVYTSALIRSQQSVEQFIQQGIPHEALTALNEISWGSREGQQITPEEDAYYHWVLRQWQEGKTSMPIESGESPDQVAERQRSFIKLLESRSEDKTILVCMHGRAMRILLCQLLNYPLRSMDMFEHKNLGLYVLNRTEKQYSVALYNNTDHLSRLSSERESVLASSKS